MAPSSSPTRLPIGIGSTKPAPFFIDPGSPWQNAWIEPFNGRLRDEHLNGQLFDSLLQARVLTEHWRIDYNINRRHSGLGRKTPAEWLSYRNPLTRSVSLPH
jgi:transposase InsO family protein